MESPAGQQVRRYFMIRLIVSLCHHAAAVVKHVGFSPSKSQRSQQVASASHGILDLT